MNNALELLFFCLFALRLRVAFALQRVEALRCVSGRCRNHLETPENAWMPER